MNKRLVLFLGMLCLAITGFSQQALTITPLTQDFYIYTTYHSMDNGELYPANGMYVVTDAGVVLMDTPWDITQCQPLLDSIAARHHKPVVMSISTHSHEDRTGGIDFLKAKGVKTYSSALTYELCKANKHPQAEYRFMGDTTFTLGNHSFSVYFPGEGHTKDNVVVWFEKERILYGGCLIKSTETEDLGYIDEADLNAWPTTIRTLQEKCPHPAFVIPGHLGWKNSRSLQHTLKLLKNWSSKAK